MTKDLTEYILLSSSQLISEFLRHTQKLLNSRRHGTPAPQSVPITLISLRDVSASRVTAVSPLPLREDVPPRDVRVPAVKAEAARDPWEGFEIWNVFSGIIKEQCWLKFPGYLIKIISVLYLQRQTQDCDTLSLIKKKKSDRKNSVFPPCKEMMEMTHIFTLIQNKKWVVHQTCCKNWHLHSKQLIQAHTEDGGEEQLSSDTHDFSSANQLLRL